MVYVYFDDNILSFIECVVLLCVFSLRRANTTHTRVLHVLLIRTQHTTQTHTNYAVF